MYLTNVAQGFSPADDGLRCMYSGGEAPDE